MPGQLLTYADISKRTGISLGALRRRLSEGYMPKPDLRHGGSPVWYESTLKEWMETARPYDQASSRKRKRSEA